LIGLIYGQIDKKAQKPPQASAPRSWAEVRNITDKADKNKPERRQAGKAKKKGKGRQNKTRKTSEDKPTEGGGEHTSQELKARTQRNHSQEPSEQREPRQKWYRKAQQQTNSLFFSDTGSCDIGSETEMASHRN
jgi:hypothetical protein